MSEMSSWTQHYFVSCINTLLTRSQLHIYFCKKRMHCHAFMELNRASDVPAADCQNQTHKKNDRNFFIVYKDGCSEWWESQINHITDWFHFCCCFGFGKNNRSGCKKAHQQTLILDCPQHILNHLQLMPLTNYHSCMEVILVSLQEC